MDGVFEKINAAVHRYAMLPAQGRIVLGLSGGADSITLADFFVSQEDLRARLLCAHVNHGIRGEEADRDEAFVRSWCREHGAALEVLHADIPGEVRRTGESEEACGRRVRYAFFASLAPSADDRIAVAHNADDQTETILLHLVRGAGLQGLCGMAPVRGKIIRPLLSVTREEIEAHTRKRALLHVEDSTNADDAYTRNRLRHRVVPELLRLNPRLHEAMARTARTLAADEALLQEMAADALQRAAGTFPGTLRADVLINEPGPVRVRSLRRWMESFGLQDIGERQLASACACLSGGSFSIGGRWIFSVSHGTVSLSIPAEENVFKEISEEKTELPDGVFCLKGPFSEKDGKVHKLLFKNMADYDTINASLVLRHRLPGDAVTLPGRPRKSLKKLFNEAKIPVPVRDALWVLECEGNIVWVERFGVAAAYAAGPETSKMLQIHLQRHAPAHTDKKRESPRFNRTAETDTEIKE